MRKHWVAAAVIALTVLVGVVQGCSPATESGAPGTISVSIGRVTDYRLLKFVPLDKGVPPPNLQFQMPDGETRFLADMKGKVVVLNFWATWCPYCVIEMPYLQQASSELASQGVVILGINTGETEKEVRKFAADNKLTFTMILDEDQYMSILYGARYLPTTYFIDREGNVQVGKIGAFTSAQDVIDTLKPFVD